VPGKRFVNTTPLVFLARENLLEMLRIGVDEVAVPESVIAEIHGHGSDDPTVKAIESLDWLQIRPAGKVASVVALWDLGPGESAVLSLALAEESSWAVIDDWQARRCARSLGIRCIGTLGLVLLAKQTGRIPAARPVVEQLRMSGMYLSDLVISQALSQVGE
jgi:predicted nucleic acid-binding protein